MTNNTNLLAAIIIILFGITLIIFGPFLLVWALNTLFPALAIQYTFKIWLAGLILLLIFGGKAVPSKKE